MIGGTFLIPFGDTAGKILTGGAFAEPVFVAWSRFALGSLLVMLFFGGRRFDLSILADWRIWLRSAFIVGGITCILTALKTEPISNAFAAFFIGPIIAYFGSIIVLGETGNKWRVLLLFVGFLGMLIVVRPGLNVSPGIGFAFLSGTFYGCYLIASKWLSHRSNPRSMLLSQLLVGTVLLLPWGVTSVPAMTVDVTFFIFVSAFASGAGNLMIVQANRMADGSQLAPLIYCQLVSGTLLGIVVFGNYPDMLGWFGLAVLFVSGVTSFFIVSKPKVERV